MKKSLVLAMAMALGVTASAYAANPFSDVPAGHWAYDSVNKLAAAGVIEGYPDGTYGGDKLMTRYEMAQIVAKAMAKGANVDKLAAEFADELDSLGVRVAALEKKADNVKIGGQIRYEYSDTKGSLNNILKDNGDVNRLRTRLFVNGTINEDWSYYARIQNDQDFSDNAGNEETKLNRAYVDGKIGGVKVTAGRQGMYLADGNLYDDTMDAIKVSYGKNVKVTGYYAKPTNVGLELDGVGGTGDFTVEKAWGVAVSGDAGKFGWSVGYDRFKDIDITLNGVSQFEPEDGDDRDFSVFNVGVKYQAGDLGISATYLDSGVDGDGFDTDGYVIGLNYKGAKAAAPGSFGLSAKYYDQGFGTILAHTMNGRGNVLNWYGGFKGYMVGGEYTFAKNIIGTVEYYDLEGKDEDYTARTLFTRLQFAF